MDQRIQPTSELTERTAYDCFDRFGRTWNMESSERLAMMALLQWLKPSCSIEVGTREGGSLQVIAAHSGKVFTLDIDRNCIEVARLFPNTEFTAGPSSETLPVVIRTIEERQLTLEFVLIDGDHAEDSVRADIECIFKYTPIKPCYIMMHDSFNPFCRHGIISAGWEQCPYVHKVDIDLIPGKLHPPGETFRGTPVGKQLWGGIGLAVMRPEKRVGPLKIMAGSEYLYRLALRHSVHRPVVLAKRWLGPKYYGTMKRILKPAR